MWSRVSKAVANRRGKFKLKSGLGWLILSTACGCGDQQTEQEDRLNQRQKIEAAKADVEGNSGNAESTETAKNAKTEKCSLKARLTTVGDMILPESATLNLALPIPRLWPQGIIPYKIAATVDQAPDFAGAKLRDKLESAISQFNSDTEIKFVAYSAQSHQYFLEFTTSTSPSSNVGMSQSMSGQQLYLTNTIPVAGIVHEMAHAVGLYHEENRSDRNLHLIVHEDRMISACYQAYMAVTTNRPETLRTTYDFGSLMQSGLSACKRPELGSTLTLEPINAQNNPLPARQRLSPNDIAEIHALYDSEITARKALESKAPEPAPTSIIVEPENSQVEQENSSEENKASTSPIANLPTTAASPAKVATQPSQAPSASSSEPAPTVAPVMAPANSSNGKNDASIDKEPSNESKNQVQGHEVDAHESSCPS